jgi:hypothetical protein
MALVVLCGLVACEQAPATIDDCTALAAPVEREQCYFGLVQAVAYDHQALERTVGEIPLPMSRDLIRLRMAVNDPVQLGWLCKNVEGEDAQTRCINIVRRPHLLKPPPGSQ